MRELSVALLAVDWVSRMSPVLRSTFPAVEPLESEPLGADRGRILPVDPALLVVDPPVALPSPSSTCTAISLVARSVSRYAKLTHDEPDGRRLPPAPEAPDGSVGGVVHDEQ
jgi:hypothetical protein